jgi:hypothetical protein
MGTRQCHRAGVAAPTVPEVSRSATAAGPAPPAQDAATGLIGPGLDDRVSVRGTAGAAGRARGEAGRTPHTSGPSMHDAPPPPLDRQGIGRPRRPAQRSDITLNDASGGRLRRGPALSRTGTRAPSGGCNPVRQRCDVRSCTTPTPRAPGAPVRSLVCEEALPYAGTGGQSWSWRCLSDPPQKQTVLGVAREVASERRERSREREETRGPVRVSGA